MKKIFIYIVSMMFLASCVDSLDDFNVDQKRASQVPPGTLFTGAVKALTDVMTTPNVNTNNYRFYVQHWTSTQYLDEPRYNMTSRTIPQSMFQTLYRDVLADLNDAKRLIEEDEAIVAEVKNNQLAQVEIMEVYTWSILLNTFGNVPYSQALDPEVSLPAYDDAATVYNDILSRLDAALDLIQPTADGLGSADVIYDSDMAMWEKFGNSLKLKLAMVIADVNPDQAKSLVEEAAPNVFTSNADNAAFPYLPSAPNNNPVSENINPLRTSREDYVPANTLVDAMNELEDPRRARFFTQYQGGYKGGRYGFTNSFSELSHVHDDIIALDFESLLLDYVEVEFLLAEAVERGFNVGGSAVEHYNAAVTASFDYWGAAGSAAYLAKPEVNYASASGDWKQKIGTQKWIALYNRGFEAWLEWRRLDAPTLLPPAVEGLNLIVPTRLIYPVNEQTLNGANRNAAADAIGGDQSSTKLWWDIN
ncbi:MAG TPA: SusD/RagB family nutrient-binding outer membrane lipoprotein [Cyclobacteriaceae bacterium]|nr:SusD/RagB family nutrient-binding outer membrane lipoprotein [Cyclobacteriaceae bacterium]